MTQYKAMSLDRHINTGWRHYFCTELGEFIDVLPPQQRIDEQWYQGTADAVYQNLDIIRSCKPEFILILGGDHVYKMDYGVMLATHEAAQADLTVGCLEVSVEEAAGALGVLVVDEGGRIIGFEEKPNEPKTIPGDDAHCLASMGIYVFTARFLFEQLCRDANLVLLGKPTKGILREVELVDAHYAQPEEGQRHAQRGSGVRGGSTSDSDQSTGEKAERRVRRVRLAHRIFPPLDGQD